MGNFCQLFDFHQVLSDGINFGKLNQSQFSGSCRILLASRLLIFFVGGIKSRKFLNSGEDEKMNISMNRSNNIITYIIIRWRKIYTNYERIIFKLYHNCNYLPQLFVKYPGLLHVGPWNLLTCYSKVFFYSFFD